MCTINPSFDPLAWLEEDLSALTEQSQMRSLQPSFIVRPGWMERDGREMLNLSSNDYLGLAQTKTEVPSNVNTGSGASRLITGNHDAYRRLEEEFAKFKGMENCLVFSNGYMANLGTIQALVGRGDAVYSDRLNHASIVDGIVLSRAAHRRYRHRDLNHLEAFLKKDRHIRKKLIVTDAVFSMDGSLAPLKDIVYLKKRYGAMLMVDEAHSGGIFGPDGKGLAAALNVNQDVDVHMGTFSKAYGAYGAYVAGDQRLIRYLVNKARSMIYTTALPETVLQHVHANWSKSVAEPWRKSDCLAKSAWFRNALLEHGFQVGISESQIIPLMVGSNELAVTFSQALQQANIAAVAIRPPTVPQGTARIRFTVMAVHEWSDLHMAIERIATIGRTLGVINS